MRETIGLISKIQSVVLLACRRPSSRRSNLMAIHFFANKFKTDKLIYSLTSNDLKMLQCGLSVRDFLELCHVHYRTNGSQGLRQLSDKCLAAKYEHRAKAMADLFSMTADVDPEAASRAVITVQPDSDLAADNCSDYVLPQDLGKPLLLLKAASSSTASTNDQRSSDGDVSNVEAGLQADQGTGPLSTSISAGSEAQLPSDHVPTARPQQVLPGNVPDAASATGSATLSSHAEWIAPNFHSATSKLRPGPESEPKAGAAIPYASLLEHAAGPLISKDAVQHSASQKMYRLHVKKVKAAQKVTKADRKKKRKPNHGGNYCKVIDAAALKRGPGGSAGLPKGSVTKF